LTDEAGESLLPDAVSPPVSPAVRRFGGRSVSISLE
jgi:hypothetical protein